MEPQRSNIFASNNFLAYIDLYDTRCSWIFIQIKKFHNNQNGFLIQHCTEKICSWRSLENLISAENFVTTSLFHSVSIQFGRHLAYWKQVDHRHHHTEQNKLLFLQVFPCFISTKSLSSSILDCSLGQGIYTCNFQIRILYPLKWTAKVFLT